jgi:hypothetical protein
LAAELHKPIIEKLEPVVILERVDEPTPMADASAAASSTSPEVRSVGRPKMTPTRCPGCNMMFKNINMHKCKNIKKISPPLKKIKPSEVALKLKCEVCKQHFTNYEALTAHQNAEHSRLICNTCKYVATSTRSLRSHSDICGKVIITSVFKSKKANVKVSGGAKKQAKRVIAKKN